MKTILCPTDFSANAENALKYAIDINKTLKAKIILLHTFDTPLFYGNMGTFTLQMDNKVVFDAAAVKLKAFYHQFFTDKDNVELMLLQGLASYRICEIAIEKKVDMIIMGATGAGAAARMIMGSNAVRVAKEAHCKVMLIPENAKFEGLEKIVYATDLTDDNLVQARELFPLAEIFNAELLFLYINKDLPEPDNDLLELVRSKIKQFIPYSKKSGYVCADESTLDGVEYFLKKNKTDCLAMFHRHRNLFQSLYHPSISKKVSLHASIPVLIIHQDDFAIHL